MTALAKLEGIEAEFWDAEGADSFSHRDPVSALAAVVENHLERGRTTEEVIREMGELSLDAYRRSTHTDADVEDAIDCALDAARQALEEDSLLGDPDGERPMFKVDVLAKHRPAFASAVRALLADAKVWQCETAASVPLSPDETIEILRGERPDWFASRAAEAEAAPWERAP